MANREAEALKQSMEKYIPSVMVVLSTLRSAGILTADSIQTINDIIGVLDPEELGKLQRASVNITDKMSAILHRTGDISASLQRVEAVVGALATEQRVNSQKIDILLRAAHGTGGLSASDLADALNITAQITKPSPVDIPPTQPVTPSQDTTRVDSPQKPAESKREAFLRLANRRKKQ